MLLTASVAERRDPDRARQLLEAIDFATFGAELQRQKMLPTVVARLGALLPDAIPPAFRPSFDTALELAAQRSLLVEGLSVKALMRLEEAGVAAMPLKGPLLAKELYDEQAVRPSSDIDLLVGRNDFQRALTALEQEGYRPLREPVMANGLPIIHWALGADAAWRPHLDLHWRVHWFDRWFSQGMLARGLPPHDGRPRRAQPPDQLAALLLFYARDGFAGLRYAADIAAWWDRYGETAGDEPMLASRLAAHPELHASLAAAAAVAEGVVGVPADRIVPPAWGHAARTRLAQRLVNWTAEGTDRERAANITLVDWLLVPRSGLREAAARHLAITRTYGGNTDGDEHAEDPFRSPRARAGHYAAGMARFAGRYARALWQVRRGRSLSPISPPLPASARGASRFARALPGREREASSARRG